MQISYSDTKFSITLKSLSIFVSTDMPEANRKCNILIYVIRTTKNNCLYSLAKIPNNLVTFKFWGTDYEVILKVSEMTKV